MSTAIAAPTFVAAQQPAICSFYEAFVPPARVVQEKFTQATQRVKTKVKHINQLVMQSHCFVGKHCFSIRIVFSNYGVTNNLI